MVKTPCSNFRVIIANFSGVRIFRIFTVVMKVPVLPVQEILAPHQLFSTRLYHQILLCPGTDELQAEVDMKRL